LSARTAKQKYRADSSTLASSHVSAPQSAKSTGPSPAVEIEILPAPENAERILDALARLGCAKPDERWLYFAAGYSRAFYILRWNRPDGSKAIRPVSWSRSARGKGWDFKAWPAARPLYNLPRIAKRPAANILICEGEKAADAAEGVFGKSVITTTSSGGAAAAAKTDWSPLEGRTVWIWPDADDAGLRYADDVARRLVDLRCAVSIIDAIALASLSPANGSRKANLVV
jgi:putative DNA primase/helicase